MGFLGFGKKKHHDEDMLDIPPPPPLEQMPGQASQPAPSQPPPRQEPDFPSQASFGQQPLFPGQDFSSFSQPQEDLWAKDDWGKDDARDDAKDMKMDFPAMSAPASRKEEQHDDTPRKAPKWKGLGDIFSKPREESGWAPTSAPSSSAPARPLVSSKPLFVEIGRYREVMKELNLIKKALKQSDAEVKELVADIEDEERTFSKLHQSLQDVEGKLGELEDCLFVQE